MRRILSSAIVLGGLALAACSGGTVDGPNAPPTPSTSDALSTTPGSCTYACTTYHFTANQCYEGWLCDAQGACLSYVGTPDAPTACPMVPVCTPTTCAAESASCGSISDNCGGTLSCGDCASGLTCGGGGTANVCGAPTPPPPPPPPADPFTLPTGVASATNAQILQAFGGGGTSASTGSFAVSERNRSSCTALTGCSAWSAESSVTLANVFYSTEDDAYGDTPYTLGETSGTPLLTLDPDLNQIEMSFAAGAVNIECTIPNVSTSTVNSTIGTIGCTVYGGQNQLLWFLGYYLGSPTMDDTTLIEWQGSIYADGTFQLVTQTGLAPGTGSYEQDAANNLNQIAISGRLF